MEDHKDQRMTEPLEEDPELCSDSSYSSYTDSSDDEEMTDQFVDEESKTKKLNELKRRAFYSVLLAFKAETFSSGNKRTQIIEKLMNEWSIAQETRASFEDSIQKNLVAHRQRVVSEAKKPLIIRLPAKKPTHVATTPCSSWGRVNPEALVGRRVCVRMDGEDEFEVLVIKEFNAKDGTHRLATVDPNVKWLNEASSWMDVRKIPAEDIKWRHGEDPKFETPPGSGAGQ
ncbi:Emsy N Terminus (ENT) domain-containing protein [Raphanus sativus]|uniref:Protein EMSY-LIKE 1 n=1 Tax=Raphanus sativus TaxID=3726 RepID=A0A6J0NE40_RAPSA|nr:protein EMSY-LIKE 1 [Raphanus sativus]KAJ4904898.1 Emsy N Terminus (ENT) domain-containing protein [Raphanus sativus]